MCLNKIYLFNQFQAGNKNQANYDTTTVAIPTSLLWVSLDCKIGATKTLT
jgi:hypothetical protein